MAFPVAPGYNNLPNGNFSPIIYSKKVLKAFRKASVVEDITNTDYSGEIENFGDTVEIIQEPDISVVPYVRGQNLATQSLNDAAITLVVDHANSFQFEVDDIEKKFSHVNWETLATSRAGYKLKDAFDSEVLTYMFTQATNPTELGTTGSNITVDNSGTTGHLSPLQVMNKVSRLMDLNNIPTDERWFVGDPIFWELMADENSKFVNALYIGPDRAKGDMPLVNGRLFTDEIRGFTCYKSNNLPISGNPNSGGYAGFIAGHMSSAATVNQIAKIEQFRSPTSFADRVRGLHLYGRKVLRPAALFTGYYTTTAA